MATDSSTAAHILLLLLLLLSLYVITVSSTTRHRRHLLHQPFFPLTTTVPPSQPPVLSPQPQTQAPTQPKYPFSSTTTPNYPQNQKPFFPTFPSPPPPPSVSSLATFPANISSLLFPHPPSSPSHRHLIITISVSVSLLFAAILAALSAFFLHSRHHHRHIHTTTSDKTSLPDNVRLFPPDTVHSDGSPKLPKLSPRPGVPNTSSEFLYLGTLVNSRAGVDDHHQHHNKSTVSGNATVKIGVSSSPYQKLGSPELKPLPPLPKHNYTPSYRSGEVLIGSFNKEDEAESDTEEEEFFSPRGSSGRKEIPQESSAAAAGIGMGMGIGIGSSSRREFQGENFGSRSFNSRTASYPYSNSCSPSNSIPTIPSPVSNASPQSTKSKSPDTIIAFPVPVQSAKHSSPSISSSSSSSPGNAHISPERNLGSLGQYVPVKLPPPPPPPLPPPRFWEMPAGVRVGPEASFGGSGPPVLLTPSGRVLVQNGIPTPTLSGEQEQLQKSGSGERSEGTPKPRLKPLHWDKVRASSDRAMVWDQIKTSSFQLNEEMIETLFVVNNSNLNGQNRSGRRLSLPLQNQETRVLDAKKSQNIAILLRALNVTIDEVCEALLEGNSDSLGTELLESLLKMAPTEEEERKLKEFKDESPLKLGPAEKFLKAVLDIPFAFRRVDAMLYIANFDSEVEYLKRSFEILETACEELRNSRMFLKLLEAVLKTGNRMNVGTNRGDAHAFKLDTLLKLVDVKGTDGKTTLLHFVVQEIIRSEGSRLSGANQKEAAEKAPQSALQDEVEFRKLGLQVVSSLSGELSNVKKAAAMDSDTLSNEVAKLAIGITKVREVLKLNEEIALKESSWKFTESMNGFLKKAEEEIVRIQAQEKVALSLVREITEYFHGNSAKEEAHRFRIFMVVRDFLSILDQVCKEVGKINERTIYSSVRPMPANPTFPQVFPGLSGRHHYASDDDDSTSSLGAETGFS